MSTFEADRRYGRGEFSPYVTEHLKYYVYLLSDPRDQKIFYVGKGTGNRVFAHARAALASEERPSDKLERIRAVINDGREVRYELLRFGLTEQAAFEVEAAAIQLLGLEELTNLVAGHHIAGRGRMSTDVAASLFEAEPVDEIVEKVLLIKVPKLWYPSMPPEDLMEATTGWWVIGERREGADYAFAVHRGVIREVYAIHGWRRRQPGDRGSDEDAGQQSRRWGFEASVAEELSHYRDKSVRHRYKRGEASPIKFVNC